MNKLLLLAFLFLINCSSSKTNNEESRSGSLSLETISATSKDWIDSLLTKQDTAKLIVRNEKEKFLQLTKNSKFIHKEGKIKNRLASKWVLDTSFVHHDHWLEFQTADEKLKVLGSAGTDNSALWLVTFDDKQNVIDRYEISGGECDGGWNEEQNGQLCSCGFKMAIQVNDSTFLIRKVKECQGGNKKTEFIKFNKWVIYINSASKVVERGPAEHNY